MRRLYALALSHGWLPRLGDIGSIVQTTDSWPPPRAHADSDSGSDRSWDMSIPATPRHPAAWGDIALPDTPRIIPVTVPAHEGGSGDDEDGPELLSLAWLPQPCTLPHVSRMY